MDEKIKKLVLFMLSNKQKPLSPIKDKEMKKLKQIDALNRKLIPRVSSYTDKEIFQHYKKTISVIQTILELKFYNDDEVDVLLEQYSIDVTSVNELRELLLIFCKIGLEKVS